VKMPQRVLGRSALSNGRFPLLLKYLDAQQPLSVQVHPNNEQARQLQPDGPGLGKTEAWFIISSQRNSLLYSGLKSGVHQAEFENALRGGTLPEVLHTFAPQSEDCIFLEAGTIHAIGSDLILFEVQQTSDITYRLYDWGRVDPHTGLPRQLHIEQALLCSNYESGPCNPVAAVVDQDKHRTAKILVQCEFFTLRRLEITGAIPIGRPGECRVLVAMGTGQIRWANDMIAVNTWDVIMIPAETPPVTFIPDDPMVALECELPVRV
jgi:mannose-6-phosphate isomerase